MRRAPVQVDARMDTKALSVTFHAAVFVLRTDVTGRLGSVQCNVKKDILR